MGMDVFGKNPTADEGEYFRNNVWYWRPLANYCIEVDPDSALGCTEWHTNDGDGLGAEGAVMLAVALEKEVESGRTEEYAQAFQAGLDALPLEHCKTCDGTGVRHDGERFGREPDFPCNGCGGKGQRPSLDTWYAFDVENVREFIAFLKASGGFEIH